MQYTKEKKWRGGTSSEIVAKDAKNGTAISAVAFTLNQTEYVSITPFEVTTWSDKQHRYISITSRRISKSASVSWPTPPDFGKMDLSTT